MTQTGIVISLGTPGLGGMSPADPSSFGATGLAIETMEVELPVR